MDVQQLKAELKSYALSVGIDLVGVCSAEPFETDRQRLEELRQRGLRPSPFQEQEIGKRVDLNLLLPGVRSVIAAGINYLAPNEDDAPPAGGRAPAPGAAPGGSGAPAPGTAGPDAPPGPDAASRLRGWISRYCRSPRDYHFILQERLELVAAWLTERVPGSRNQVYVDTGPPIDRSVAVRAGIGKWGKSTNLLTKYGTWVFLGEILTDVALPPDQPLGDACGRCTLCLDACPTGAFVEPFVLDNDRCLSYLTQVKGYMPAEYREAMGNRIFGCDDCQDVCPWNRRPRYSEDAAWQPHPELRGGPGLLQLLMMDNDRFRSTWKQTAAGWRGKTVLQRNALIALGNEGDPDALAPLLGALQDQRSVMRGTAAWALGRLAALAPQTADEAVGALREMAARERDAGARREAEAALTRIAAGDAAGRSAPSHKEDRIGDA